MTVRANSLFHICIENPQRRERTGRGGNYNLRHPQCTRELAGMERAGSAEGNQREAAWIVASLDRDAPQSCFHLRIYHAHNSFGQRLHGFHRTSFAEEPLECSASAVCIELHSTAEEMACCKATENEICICNCCLLATARIAGRPRRGSGGLRANAQHSA